MTPHQNLNDLLERKVKPAFMFICQVGESIRIVEIDSIDEMPAVEKWMADAGQWQTIKPFGLYQSIEQPVSSTTPATSEQQSASSTEQPRRRGRPPRSESAQPTSAAGVVAGGIDPGPLEDTEEP